MLLNAVKRKKPPLSHAVNQRRLVQNLSPPPKPNIASGAKKRFFLSVAIGPGRKGGEGEEGVVIMNISATPLRSAPPFLVVIGS